jgi:hypothetical protein
MDKVTVRGTLLDELWFVSPHLPMAIRRKLEPATETEPTLGLGSFFAQTFACKLDASQWAERAWLTNPGIETDT